MMPRRVENGFAVPLTTVESYNGSEKGSAASYPSTPAHSYCLSTEELRKVVDNAYSETLAEVHMSDSSRSVSDVFDGMTATTVECQDSELSIGMSAAFLQFKPSMSTAISYCADEPKGFEHRLCEALNQFGLNSLEVETRKSLVMMVNSFNVLCSDPLPAVVGLGLTHSETLGEKLGNPQMVQIPPSSRSVNRRRKKSGTVLCLMPLPEGGLCGDHDLLTVRSAPTVLQETRPASTRRGSNLQPSISRSAHSNAFGLTPRDPVRCEQQLIISACENLPNSSITVASGLSMTSTLSGRSQTLGSPAASGVRSRSQLMMQRLAQEQLSPTRTYATGSSASSGARSRRQQSIRGFSEEPLSPTPTQATRSSASSGVRSRPVQSARGLSEEPLSPTRTQATGSSASSGVRSRPEQSIRRRSEEQLSPPLRSSRRTIGSPLCVGRSNPFDNTDMSVRRGASDSGFEGLQQGTPTPSQPGKKELKKFFNAIFKHQLQHSSTPEWMMAQLDTDGHDARNSRHAGTDHIGSTSAHSSSGSNRSGGQGKFR